MASWPVNSVLRVRLEWHNSVTSNLHMNVLHYRVHEGTVTDAQKDDMLGSFEGDLTGPIRGMMGNWMSLVRLHIQKINAPIDLEVERVYDVGSQAGGITSSADVEPQAAACLVRKSFIPGRKGIGRFYMAGLIGEYTSNGRLVIDPVGSGDLDTVSSALIATVSDTNGHLYRPSICPANGAGVTSQNDVRKQTWSSRITYLKSRRENVGV